MNKLSLPTIEERYDGPFDQCKYWPLFKIDDHRRRNDVMIISFEPAKGCDVNELEETFVATLREVGKTMARSVVIGGKGAYSVDAEDSKYYLVEWTADPPMIEEDNVIMVVNQPCSYLLETGYATANGLILFTELSIGIWWETLK
jgi:hypothetical protein